jgi:hypothetical protein
MACSVLVGSLATTAQAAVITFDDVVAPTLLADAQALTTQYSAQGVTFSGTGAILHEDSDFMITGYSPSNFLAYLSEAFIDFAGSSTTSEASDVLTFSSPLSAVSFKAGSGLTPGAGRLLTVHGFNAGGMLVASQAITLGSTLQTVALSGQAITRVTLAATLDFTGEEGVGFVVDDLMTTPAGAAVPEPALFTLLVPAMTGWFMARRRSAR